MKLANNIKKLIRDMHVLDIDTSDEMDRRIVRDALKAQEKLKGTRSAVTPPNTWRIIMNNKTTKFAAAAVIVLFLGLMPINGTTAFGKMAYEVASTLSHLKAFMMGRALPDNKYLSADEIDKSVKILTTNKVYSGSEISSLKGFLNGHNIYFASAGSGDVKYAVIPANTIDSVMEFLSSSGTKYVSRLKTLTYGGQEVIMTVTGHEQETKKLGVAIIVNKDGNHHLILDFAFDNTDDGCEVNGIRLAKGEALLISGIKTDSGDLMTILSLPEIQNK